MDAVAAVLSGGAVEWLKVRSYGQGESNRNMHYVEFWAGAANVDKAMQSYDFVGVAYDKIFNESTYNINSVT